MLTLTSIQDSTRPRSDSALVLRPDDRIAPSTGGVAAAGRQWSLLITVEPQIPVDAAHVSRRSQMAGRLGFALDTAP